jgi:hypothetical protein
LTIAGGFCIKNGKHWHKSQTILTGTQNREYLLSRKEQIEIIGCFVKKSVFSGKKEKRDYGIV